MTDPAALTRAKKSRSGHRASASKIILKVEEEVLNSPKPSQQKLKQHQQALKMKQQTLDDINEVILNHVDEDSLEEEIDGIDAVKEKIGLSLLSIEEALSQLESAKLSNLAPVDTVRSADDTTTATQTPASAPHERSLTA